MAVVVSCKYSIIQNELELEMFNFEEEGKLENPEKNSLSKARRNLRRFPLNVRAVSAKIKFTKKILAALSHFENR